MPSPPKSDLAVEATDVRKTFGSFAALAGITMDLRRGEFLALFGRNGAGKTTFLKIAATLMRPSQGKVKVEGFDIREEPERARSKIGFLSHNTYIYRDLSPIENLRFFGRLYGVVDAEQRIPLILDRVGLRRRSNDPVRSFSRGLQQRIGIARVLLHQPSLILLDEPYTGLDANAVLTLDQLLDEAVQQGNTVILTTHDLNQGLRAATKAAIIDRGKLVFMENANNESVREAYAHHVRTGERQ
jgi:heme exporter protein A